MFDFVSFIPRAIMQGIPLLFGSTGETLTEKSGNLNLGILLCSLQSCDSFLSSGDFLLVVLNILTQSVQLSIDTGDIAFELSNGSVECCNVNLVV